MASNKLIKSIYLDQNVEPFHIRFLRSEEFVTNMMDPITGLKYNISEVNIRNTFVYIIVCTALTKLNMFNDIYY